MRHRVAHTAAQILAVLGLAFSIDTALQAGASAMTVVLAVAFGVACVIVIMDARGGHHGRPAHAR